MRRGEVHHRLAGTWMELMVFAEPTVFAEPSEGALDNPATREDFKADGVIAAAHDVQHPMAVGFDPVDQLTCIAAIGPQPSEPGKVLFSLGQQLLGAVAILYVTGMHDDHQQQSDGVDEDVALPAIHFLGGIIAIIHP